MAATVAQLDLSAKTGTRGRLLSGVAAGAFLAGSAFAQDSVGVTSAVNPQATGTPPQRSSRTLNVGLEMFRNERIATGAEGKTQLLFMDGSALTIGPNSEVVLDEFVYDPSTQTGKLAMSATKGVFRLVGGKISKTDAITLKTPTATLGIRGGITIAEVTAGGGFFGFLFGQQMTVDGTGSDGQPTQQVVTRPGTGVPLGPGGVVLPPVPIPQDKINQQMGSLEGNRGQSGGAREQPTDSRVAASGLGDLGSTNAPSDLVPPRLVASDPEALTGALAEDVDLATAAQVDSVAESAMLAVPVPLFGTGFTGRFKSTPGSGIGLGSGDGSPFLNRPVIGGPVGGDFVGVTIAPGSVPGDALDGFLYQAPLSGTVLETHPRGTFFNFSSAGTTSPFGPIEGVGFASSNNDFVFYAAKEVNLPGERSLLFAGVPTPFATIDSIGNKLVTFDVRGDAIFGSSLAFVAPQYGGNLPGTRSPALLFGSAGPGSQVAFLQGNLAISGQGAAQQSAVSVLVGRGVRGPSGGNGLLDGQMRGTFRTSASAGAGFLTGTAGFASDALGNGVYGANSPDFFLLESSGQLNPSGSGDSLTATSLPIPDGIKPNLGGASDAAYFPNNLALRIDNQAGVGVNRPSASMNGFFAGVFDQFPPAGGPMPPMGMPTGIRNAGSSFASFGMFADATNNTVVGVFMGEEVFPGATYVLPFGGVAGDGRSAYIDKDRYAAVESAGGGPMGGAQRNGVPAGAFLFYLVGNELVSTTNFLPVGVSYCDCPASTFGFWGMDFVRQDGFRDRVHLGQFVAGVVPSVAEVPTMGTGNYAGHAVADVVRGATRYKAAGSFTLTWHFDTFNGTWNAAIDGTTLMAPVSTSPGTANKYGSTGLSGNFGPDTLTGSVAGTFFKGPGNPVAETGSQFNASGLVSGQPYLINGVTQGKQTSLAP